jgi:hypothetical protein
MIALTKKKKCKIEKIRNTENNTLEPLVGLVKVSDHGNLIDQPKPKRTYVKKKRLNNVRIKGKKPPNKL